MHLQEDRCNYRWLLSFSYRYPRVCERNWEGASADRHRSERENRQENNKDDRNYPSQAFSKKYLSFLKAQGLVDATRVLSFLLLVEKITLVIGQIVS